MQAKPVLDSDGSPTGEYTFQANGACRAVELIGKHFAMFTDKMRAELASTVQGRHEMSDEELMAIASGGPR